MGLGGSLWKRTPLSSPQMLNAEHTLVITGTTTSYNDVTAIVKRKLRCFIDFREEGRERNIDLLSAMHALMAVSCMCPDRA